jgi:hypothetical protein
MSEEELWTLVQHSGFGYSGNPQFRRGLQAARVKSNRDRKSVEQAGGMFFTDYMAAENYGQKVSYPTGYTGMIPLAPGQFSPMKLDGLAIYVPVPAVV